MIPQIDPADPRLSITPGEPLILAMIQGLAKTAGPGLRREFWLPLDRAGHPAGAVCRTESGLFATVSPRAAEEAAALLTALGDLPGTVDSHLTPLLPGLREPFPVLAYRGPLPAEIPLSIPSAMALADCNVSAGAIPPEARDDLYAELHLRIRRGAAQIVLVPDEAGHPAAGAAALLGERAGVIGCLACRREAQGRGYGSAALTAAVRCLLERDLLPLLACRAALTPFYQKRGFTPAGEVWEKIIPSRPERPNSSQHNGG